MIVLHELIEARKMIFKPGLFVVAVKDIDDPFTKIPKGTKGIVRHVDDIGTVHINWETGSGIGALLEDKIRICN